MLTGPHEVWSPTYIPQRNEWVCLICHCRAWLDYRHGWRHWGQPC